MVLAGSNWENANKGFFIGFLHVPVPWPVMLAVGRLGEDGVCDWQSMVYYTWLRQGRSNSLKMDGKLQYQKHFLSATRLSPQQTELLKGKWNVLLFLQFLSFVLCLTCHRASVNDQRMSEWVSGSQDLPAWSIFSSPQGHLESHSLRQKSLPNQAPNEWMGKERSSSWLLSSSMGPLWRTNVTIT